MNRENKEKMREREEGKNMYREFLNASNVITEVNLILRNNGGVVVNPCANHTHDDSTRYR